MKSGEIGNTLTKYLHCFVKKNWVCHNFIIFIVNVTGYETVGEKIPLNLSGNTYLGNTLDERGAQLCARSGRDG